MSASDDATISENLATTNLDKKTMIEKSFYQSLVNTMT